MSKKIIRFLMVIVLFAVGAVGVTYGLIKSTKENQKQQNTETLVKKEDESFIQIPEKGLDVNGFYNENDIIFYAEKITYQGKEFAIPVISGLKNKAVENRVNQSMKEKILQRIDKNLITNPEMLNYEVCANYANVISIVGFYATPGFGEEKEKDYQEMFPLNYELVNGAELTLEDLFVKDANIVDLMKKAMFHEIVEKNYYVGSYYLEYYWPEESIEYNRLVGKAIEEKISWEAVEEYKKTHEQYSEQVALDEEKVYKTIKNYFQNYQTFYFTPNQIFFTYIPKQSGASISIFCSQDWKWPISIVENAEIVVIYDKYLTEESLYERDDIASKKLYVGAKQEITNLLTGNNYKKYGFQRDNLFYAIDIVGMSSYNTKEECENNLKYVGIIMDSFKEELATYEQKATENPQTMYFFQKAVRYYAQGKYDWKTGRYLAESPLKQVEEYSKLEEYPITPQNFASQFQSYMQSTSYNWRDNFEMTYGVKNVIGPWFNNVYWNLYDVRDCRELYYVEAKDWHRLETLEDIFYPDSNYREVITEAIKNDKRNGRYQRTDEEVEYILENAKYTIEDRGIRITWGEEYPFVFIEYRDFGDAYRFKYWD